LVKQPRCESDPTEDDKQEDRQETALEEATKSHGECESAPNQGAATYGETYNQQGSARGQSVKYPNDDPAPPLEGGYAKKNRTKAKPRPKAVCVRQTSPDFDVNGGSRDFFPFHPLECQVRHHDKPDHKGDHDAPVQKPRPEAKGLHNNQ
jgi:hypothetical protein